MIGENVLGILPPNVISVYVFTEFMMSLVIL